MGFMTNNLPEIQDAVRTCKRSSTQEIDEVELICRKINCPDISNDKKRQSYIELERIYDKYFVQLPSQADQIKGL